MIHITYQFLVAHDNKKSGTYFMLILLVVFVLYMFNYLSAALQCSCDCHLDILSLIFPGTVAHFHGNILLIYCYNTAL